MLQLSRVDPRVALGQRLFIHRAEDNLMFLVCKIFKDAVCRFGRHGFGLAFLVAPNALHEDGIVEALILQAQILDSEVALATAWTLSLVQRQLLKTNVIQRIMWCANLVQPEARP